MPGNPQSRVRVAVIVGGPSQEHEVSLASGKSVLEHLDKQKYVVRPTLITKRGRWRIGSQHFNADDALKELQKSVDVAFLALHGRFGEDGTIQSLLDIIRLPYTGSGAAASALAFDKHLSNLVFRAAGLSVPTWRVIKAAVPIPHFQVPVVVKPVKGGSSIDVSIVRGRSALRTALRKLIRRHGQVLVQQYVRGREVTCGVIEKMVRRPTALPPTKIRPRTSELFDYNAKYSPGSSDVVTPAPLTERQTQQLQQLTLRAHKLLGCRGMSRSDFIFDGRRFWILETNTIPGMTVTSLFPQEALAAGLSYSAMIDCIINAGLRHSVPGV